MKTEICLLMLFFTTMSSLCISQTKPTTEEEYNYVTKGYKVQIESGLDMKKGYVFQDVGDNFVIGDYEFNFKALVRESSKELAALMVVAKSDYWSTKGTHYLCIPIQNDDLMPKYFAQLAKFDTEMLKAYSYITSTLLTQTWSFVVSEDLKVADN